MNHHGEIQAFWRWHWTTRRAGVGGPDHAARCDFIPFSAVQEYFGASQRVERLLAALDAKKVDAHHIRKHYLRTLAILILIGQGPMINHFSRYSSLTDKRLPFRTRPEDFPHSPDAEFFDKFHAEQWQFCVMALEYNMDLQLHKEEILPIIEKEEIGRGGNATIFKIVVDSDYNKLVPHRLKTPVRKMVCDYLFTSLTWDRSALGTCEILSSSRRTVAQMPKNSTKPSRMDSSTLDTMENLLLSLSPTTEALLTTTPTILFWNSRTEEISTNSWMRCLLLLLQKICWNSGIGFARSPTV